MATTAVGVEACRGSSAPGRALHVGVLLPLSGPDDVGWRRPLEWAVDNVNRAGGAAGRPITLVYRDIAKDALAPAAREMAKDPNIVAVIGPDTSQRTFDVAGALVQGQKVIVTPSATSADLYRAFAGSPFFWRTVESDIAQVRELLLLASRGGAHTVSLLASDDAYGTTFFDWFTVMAEQLGLQVTANERYDHADRRCEQGVDNALRGDPDALIAVPTDTATAACVVRRSRQAGGRTRLLLSDAAEAPSLVRALGAGADGVEGVGLSADGHSGFDEAFARRFGRSVTPYSANAYDAVSLIAYGLERSKGTAGRNLATAMVDVIRGRGPATGWDASGVASALRAIRGGNLPDINGATGPLTYDSDTATDLVSSTYRHWRVAHGRFVTDELLSTADSPTASAGRAAFNVRASQASQNRYTGGDYQPPRRTGLWALLVAGSSGWANYRHQADVLAQYRLLRHNGVPDDHIVVVMADDLAGARQNPEQGVVRYTPGGPNLHSDLHVDYRLADVDARSLVDIMTGRTSPRTPVVLNPGPGDDVYVFLAGHGNETGFYLGLDSPVPAAGKGSVLDRGTLASAVATMHASGRYRRLVVAVEACQGGGLGVGLATPGALLVSGSSPTEDSVSTAFDRATRVWLADEFAAGLWRLASQAPQTSLRDADEQLFLAVHGSHVSVYGSGFGDLGGVQLGEFFTP